MFLFAVLSRIKVSFEDVLIRFEHLFSNKKSGVGLELHIKRFVANFMLLYFYIKLTF